MNPSSQSAGIALQASLDSAPPGETIELGTGEYPGPFTVKRPVIVDGHGATLWALRGPLVTVTCPGVVLRNLRVEVTGEESDNGGEEGCAIVVRPGADLHLENVDVRGSIIGLQEEEGTWRYPKSLYLGRLAPGSPHVFLVRLAVAVACRVSSEIYGLEVEPRKLAAGPNELRLRIDALNADTLLYGRVLLSTAFARRAITVSAQVVKASDALEARPAGQSVAWEPPDWAALVAAPAPAPPRAAPPAPTPPAAARPPAASAPPPPAPAPAPPPIEGLPTSVQFDPYWEWLRIPPGARPPNYYELLGLTGFETGEERIRQALNERYAHVRKYTLTPPYDQVASRLLNELSDAAVCLVDPRKRAEYDRRLRGEPVPSMPASPPSAPPPVQAPVVPPPPVQSPIAPPPVQPVAGPPPVQAPPMPAKRKSSTPAGALFGQGPAAPEAKPSSAVVPESTKAAAPPAAPPPPTAPLGPPPVVVPASAPPVTASAASYRPAVPSGLFSAPPATTGAAPGAAAPETAEPAAGSSSTPPSAPAPPKKTFKPIVPGALFGSQPPSTPVGETTPPSDPASTSSAEPAQPPAGAEAPEAKRPAASRVKSKPVGPLFSNPPAGSPPPGAPPGPSPGPSKDDASASVQVAPSPPRPSPLKMKPLSRIFGAAPPSPASAPPESQPTEPSGLPEPSPQAVGEPQPEAPLAASPSPAETEPAQPPPTPPRRSVRVKPLSPLFRQPDPPRET